MALELVLRNENFYTYRNCDAPISGGPYGPYCTLGSQYREAIALLDAFVYDAAVDRYRYVTWHYQVDYPSWSIWGGTIHPETGVRETHTLLEQFAVEHAWTSTAWNGGLNKRYAFYVTVPPTGAQGVVEITRADNLPTAEQIANPVLSSAQIPNLVYSQFAALISPENKYATLFDAIEGIVVYDYANHPAVAVKKWSQPFPEANTWSAGYEDEQRVWGLFSNVFFGASGGVHQSVMKYNYLSNRVELLSELQQGNGVDTMALIAFDTTRKKLAAFRVKPDAPVTGAAVNALEIYSPRPAMTQITVPINISRLAPDVKTHFRAHLLGTKAEAGSSRVLELTNSNALGSLPRKQVYTEESGAVQFEYRSSTDIMTDTITAQFDEIKVIL